MNLHHGDCLDIMAAMEPESVDAIVTDPPYGLEFMGKEWDSFKSSGVFAGGGRGGSIYRDRTSPPPAAPRFIGGSAAYDFHARWAEAAYRVAKPSAYLLAFGGTRTVHRMTCALEDAGWIIRDMLVWGYASGFPKSKASLKPAWEPIVMARKPGPLRMLAIDECRIPMADDDRAATEAEMAGPRSRNRVMTADKLFPVAANGDVATHPLGRWPANIVLTDPIFDGGVEGVVGGGVVTSGNLSPGHGSGSDTGTFSRFFLVPKAARSDREPVLGGPLFVVGPGEPGKGGKEGYEYDPKARANVHPTVKPVDLMRHLVRIVTPSGGTVLDPFLGSGTTAIAAELEGFDWIGIEREAEYVAIAEARLNGTQRGMGLVG